MIYEITFTMEHPNHVLTSTQLLDSDSYIKVYALYVAVYIQAMCLIFHSW